MADKVKMSLDRYEGLKQRIADLEAEVERKDEEYRVLESKCQWFEEVFDMLNIPVDVIEQIGPNDISVEKYHDRMSMRDSIVIKIENIPSKYLYDVF